MHDPDRGARLFMRVAWTLYWICAAALLAEHAWAVWRIWRLSR